MQPSIDTDLLKEYIKTLIAPGIVFPGIPPRRWGQEFTRSELQTIQASLLLILRLAEAEPKLKDEFTMMDQTDRHLHWFLCKHWQLLVPLLNRYPSHRYLSPHSSAG